jgi:predicted N-acyltransferase
MPQNAVMFEFRTHRSIREFSTTAWNELLGHDPEPFLRWEFLDALEVTGCVEPSVGWAPLLLSLHHAGRLVAACPAYVKGNSEGEFVFDQSWAHFSETSLGIDYYPKLIVACPFTPATGRRILITNERDPSFEHSAVIRAFADGIRRVVEGFGLSSAHVLFPREPELGHWVDAGLAPRVGVQYHWTNQGYATFDDFLGRYNSKRRHQVKRERKEMDLQGLELRVYTGTDLTPEILDTAYEFYVATVEKYHWGRQYLNREFFQEVGSRLRDNVVVTLAHERASGLAVAGSFNLVGNGRMFGRYWGAKRDYKYLHFNVCYYAGIEECIRRGLSVFEPGAGGEHKIVRGFEPTQTYSAHWLVHAGLDRAVRAFLQREARVVHDSLDNEPSVFKV